MEEQIGNVMDILVVKFLALMLDPVTSQITQHAPHVVRASLEELPLADVNRKEIIVKWSLVDELLVPHDVGLKPCIDTSIHKLATSATLFHRWVVVCSMLALNKCEDGSLLTLVIRALGTIAVNHAEDVR